MIKLFLLLLAICPLTFSADDDTKKQIEENAIRKQVLKVYAESVGDDFTIQVFVVDPNSPTMESTDDYDVIRKDTFFAARLDDGNTVFKYEFVMRMKNHGTFYIPCTILTDPNKKDSVLKTVYFEVDSDRRVEHGANDRVNDR